MPLTAQTVSGVDPFAEELRVLHVLQPTQAGVWGYARQMADYQSRHGWDVHLAAPRPVARPTTWHEWRAVRSPLRGLLSESTRLGDIVRDVQPDAVVAHSAKAGLIARAVVRNHLPIVYIPHAWSFLAVSGAEALAARTWERVASRWTNATVCVSDSEVRAGQQASIHSPYLLLPNPVLPRWTHGDRQRTSVPSDSVDVVFVGRLAHQKGPDVLISAWETVRQEFPAAQLVIVGEGPDAAALRDAAGEGVSFLGAVDDPRPIVESARIYVQPSRWEGLSLSQLEAMWSGLSIVTTRVAGSELIWASAGGAITEIDDSQALAAAIVERLRDPDLTRDEGRRNAQYARLHHDFETTARRLAAITARAYAFGRPTSQPQIRRGHAAARGVDHSVHAS